MCDERVSLEETLRAFENLIWQGKILRGLTV
ncbi:hypothetical protein M2271_000724 [Streptomyces sp. LBL]|nr:hypothetical protein [Streptomyces sp. LBL]